MEIKKIALHQIDVTVDQPIEFNVDEGNPVIKDYIEKLIEEILDNPNKREYKFKSGNTQVKMSINYIVEDDEDIDNIIFQNSERLLDKEKDTQQKIKHMGNNVQKGSLLHIYFVREESKQVLICKLEHDEIISEDSFQIIRGLNTKKKVFKSFLLYVNTKAIFLSDKHNSKYWWSDFLELEQIRKDPENTENSLEEIVKIIDAEKKKTENKFDATILRNQVIGYYRTKEVFNFDEISEIFSNYVPYNSNFPITRINEKIIKLNENLKFDKQFSIVKEKINKRAKDKISLGPGLYLGIEDWVKNLKEKVKPYDDGKGNYGLIIISNEAYNYFQDK
ncbi:nucleoid-associated protein [Apibacter mensalis]|uniref:nucleoid-associated protein n=1 Tax=Apibacter mensalis TaxID=1586267 RepID=UPI0026EDDA00|nr:nucleoid-associated protein [Apibacter mensalis]